MVIFFRFLMNMLLFRKSSLLFAVRLSSSIFIEKITCLSSFCKKKNCDSVHFFYNYDSKTQKVSENFIDQRSLKIAQILQYSTFLGIPIFLFNFLFWPYLQRQNWNLAVLIRLQNLIFVNKQGQAVYRRQGISS